MSEFQFEEQAVEDTLRTFIQTLTDSETYREFDEASEALDEDSEATALLREFDQKQEQMQQGEFDQSVMSELQDLKSEMADNDTIQRHREAREALVELLQGTNEVITEQIGRKFAQSTGGGCC
ncbi:YlbF family regulator [Haloarcula sp. CBA1131]|uniref:halo-CC-star protein HcsL n=1 Tax=Haloarcula sp. CBA1131 TaxID=1853686 RepID=UPI0012481B1C|nr:halo-CC-star protein HcsL [Haloarcula sp. CBA1131]KAA9401020.1 YlbF family regulator [Haloarcula sp. CBA1131]